MTEDCASGEPVEAYNVSPGPYTTHVNPVRHDRMARTTTHEKDALQEVARA